MTFIIGMIIDQQVRYAAASIVHVKYKCVLLMYMCSIPAIFDVMSAKMRFVCLLFMHASTRMCVHSQHPL